MGQKVNPIGLRLGINRTWDSRWYAGADYADLLHEDLRIREFLRKRLQQAGVSRIIIERPAKKARVTIMIWARAHRNLSEGVTDPAKLDIFDLTKKAVDTVL